MEQWKIHKDRTRCEKPGCPLAAEMEYYAILQLPDCVRLERCQNCFSEIQQSAESMPFHWKIRRELNGKRQPVLDLESLRTLFDTLGEVVSVDSSEESGDQAADEIREPVGEAAAHADGEVALAPGAESSEEPAGGLEMASGLRYLVALLLIRKRRLKMVDPATPEQEDADLLVVDPKIENMEPVILFAPDLAPDRLAGLRDELTAAIGV